MAHNELFVAWLNDAHALENSIVQALESQVDLASDHPTVQNGIQQHLEATRRHAETVEGLLKQLDESPSGVKNTMAKVGGKVQGMMPGAAKDDLVKAALQDYSTEHMEIASYQSLIAAANQLGHPEIAQACQGILQEEIQMAQWLEEQIPVVTREALIAGET